MRRDPLDYLSRELESLAQQGLYRHLRILEGEQSHTSTFDHRQVVNLSSNNYLGLTTHPKLREAALDATRRLGVGSGSVRTIAGTMDIHMELERRLAAFKKTEAVSTIAEGRPATQMPAFGQTLAAGDVAALADWIYSPVEPAPSWTEADIRASRVEPVTAASRAYVSASCGLRSRPSTARQSATECVQPGSIRAIAPAMPGVHGNPSRA